MAFTMLLRNIDTMDTSSFDITPTHLRVSTMTILGTLDTVPVPVDDIYASFQQAGTMDSMHLSPNPMAAEFGGSQVTIKCKRLSIKLFKKGTVHVTGCSSVVHFTDVMDRLLTVLTVLLGPDKSMALVSARTALINANFSVGRPLVLRVLCDMMGNTASTRRNINTKIMGDHGPVTALIFKSGSVTLAGAKHPMDLWKAYETVCRTINAYTMTHTHVQHTIPQTKTRVSENIIETYDIIDGYSSRILFLCSGV